MKDKDKYCNPELIGRFFDGELEGEALSRVTGHLEICRVCRKRLEHLQGLSGSVKEYISLRGERDSGILEEKILKAIQRKEAPWWIKGKEFIFSKRLFIPAGAMASFLLIFLTLFHNPSVSGPSAIITSLSGDGTSVIIMETPETRQTILWFNEKG